MTFGRAMLAGHQKAIGARKKYAALDTGRPHAPVVYLDTQDYSRFGDMLRGKSDAATKHLFLELEQRAQSGNAIFAASMPIIGELLQYDAKYRDTTIRKAEAVERLCGPWALAFPSRLIASELSTIAQAHGLIPPRTQPTVLSPDRYWFPSVADTLINMRANIREAAQTTVAGLHLPTRALRRKAKRLVKNFDPAAAARDAAPQLAAEYGLPVEAVIGSIVALLRGAITPEEASQRLFTAIAEPVKFVETYFEKLTVDRGAIPGWMRAFGAQFEEKFIELREKAKPVLEYDFAREAFGQAMADWPRQLGRAVVNMASDDLVEFGLTPDLVVQTNKMEDFYTEMPACKIVGPTVVTYTQQILGLLGTTARVERSFGGDLIHALYLSHVDLWRGDRRFSEVVRNAVACYANRIVPKLTDLPRLIDAWHLEPA